MCKIVDHGKLRYQIERKKKDTLKKSVNKEVKELKMSYNIGDHDYDVRKRAALKFIEAGHRVKCLVVMRGREQQFSKYHFSSIILIFIEFVNFIFLS